MHKKELTERQKLLLDTVRDSGGALVADVLHITENSKAIARSALDTLVKKGYLEKRPIKMKVSTPFATIRVHSHLQKFSKYFIADPPPNP